MSHVYVVRGTEADLLPAGISRHHNTDLVYLDDEDHPGAIQTTYLGSIPQPPRGTRSLIGESPLPQEIDDTWTLHPSGWWLNSRTGTARYSEGDVLIATQDEDDS